jgi:hypothetical protein
MYSDQRKALEAAGLRESRLDIALDEKRRSAWNAAVLT